MKISFERNRKSASIGNKGFTMMEALLGLAAFCLMSSLLPISIQVINRTNQMEERLQAMEWEVFVSQIRKEIRMSQQITVLSNTISLTKDSKSVIYEQYGTKLRRRVNGTGHEILLQNVKTVSFEKVENGIIMKVLDVWGKDYSVTARSFINNG